MPSWRLGASLGIDPLSQEEKVCSFDCVYCQLDRTRRCTVERKLYVPAGEVIRELTRMPPVPVDFITLSGRGEPTLASNLGEMIAGIKKVRSEPVAVLTNTSTMNREDVRSELLGADFVIAKLDACSQDSLERVNRPAPGITIGDILEGLQTFRKVYRGKLALQVMFVESNRDQAAEIAACAREIRPDEVQINTPLRPSGVEPVTADALEGVKLCFTGMVAFTVYDTPKRPDIRPISGEETLRRRGKV